MHEMRWSWEELLRTPEYVKVCCLHFLTMRNEAQKQATESAHAKAQGREIVRY